MSRADKQRARERAQMEEMDAIAFPTAEAAAGLANPMSQWDDVKAVSQVQIFHGNDRCPIERTKKAPSISGRGK